MKNVASNTPGMQELPLRDIHLPDAVSWWPPAIGWWLLPIIIILIALAIYKFIQAKKEKQKTAYRKMALQELKTIKHTFQNKDANAECLRAISKLLRRIALSYGSREDTASLTGNQWIERLNQLSQQPVFNEAHTNLLSIGPYQQQPEFDQSDFLSVCESWINQLPAYANKHQHASNKRDLK